MKNLSITNYGTTFERVFTAVLSLITALVLFYLAVEGPLFLDKIKYKTAEVINNQLVGQDIVNMLVMCPILIIGGAALLSKKRYSVYLLLMTPLYLIYYVLSYTIGWEWSSAEYTGNSEGYTFYFLFILISSLVILLYTLSAFPAMVQSTFRRNSLIIYSVIFVTFLLVFASMWIKEIREVISTGTTRGYEIAPTAFWLVRIFDLGFSVPLGLISVYLVWARPGSSYPVQFMFYGFFITMIIAVNAMGFIMYFNNDPTFMMRDLMVFFVLLLIIATGFFYMLKNHNIIEP
jgi:hypothetical protein